MQFTDILVKKNIIDPETLSEARSLAEEKGVSIESMLKARGVSQEQIEAAKSEAGGVPFRKIKAKKIAFNILKQIPEEAVRHYKFLPLEVKDGVLEMGMVNPQDIEAREALQFIVSKLNMPFKIFAISEDDFREGVKGYKGLTGEVSKVLGELESALLDTEGGVPKEIFQSENKFVEEAPVTKMVGVILKHAVAGNASDIHIEPMSDKLKVRFRVQGELHTSLILPLRVHEAIVSRIKIITNMKIDEKRKPQDGRFGVMIDNRAIDFRVSTFPTHFGEKVVIRILDKEKGVKKLDELGFTEYNLKAIRDSLSKPYGLILLTGPTGSGKTTTLYAMLQELDREKNNVISLEDPVEYNIDGISQSQVMPEIGYTFATGLRSILRQDPDMIMVGEIRDKETAALAIQAALTGHLVFSTLHTNNAIGVVPRLVDMDIDPFLIASTLELSIGQRLVRDLCPDSRKALPVKGEVKKRIDDVVAGLPEKVKKNLKIPENVYQGVPSPSCPQGARGRIGIFEVLKKTPEMENIILTNPTEPAIFKEARRQGMLTMKEDALMKIFQGSVGLEEINKL